jgi:hypothetical protein
MLKMKIKLFKQKTLTVPTLSGWLLILIALCGAFYIFINSVNSFLSLNKPVEANMLVVEGWLPDYAVAMAMNEFKKNNYSKLITTGGPLEQGDYLSEYKTFAQLSAATYRKLGLDSNTVVAVPTPEVGKNRTYAAACDVKRWMDTSGLSILAINLISQGTHSRRSWLLYQRAFGKKIKVGIISCPDKGYDAKKWWISSKGFRAVTDEIIAYAYAKFIFLFNLKAPV